MGEIDIRPSRNMSEEDLEYERGITIKTRSTYPYRGRSFRLSGVHLAVREALYKKS